MGIRLRCDSTCKWPPLLIQIKSGSESQGTAATSPIAPAHALPSCAASYLGNPQGTALPRLLLLLPCQEQLMLLATGSC